MEKQGGGSGPPPLPISREAAQHVVFSGGIGRRTQGWMSYKYLSDNLNMLFNVKVYRM